MELREVKQRFFALRNGLLADMLRKQCQLPYKTIFGLNLPQIKAIAAEAGEDPQLGAALWADRDVRESRLLAPMLLAPGVDALKMLDEVQTSEEADVVCHSLLRRCPGALSAAIAALPSPLPLKRYAALRLMMNLLPESRPELQKIIAGGIAPHSLTDGIIRQIALELEDVEGI